MWPKLKLTVFFLSLGMTNLFSQDLYDLNSVKEIKINFDTPNWDNVLDSFKQKHLENRLTAKLVIEGNHFNKAGVKYKGNSSYNSVRKSGAHKLPFNIKLDIDDKKVTYAGGYQTLRLADCFRDPSFVREALSYCIINQYMEAPRSNFTRLYVNEKPYGLYSNVESIDDAFAQKHFGEKGWFVKCDPPDWSKTAKPLGCNKVEYSSLDYVGDDSTCYKGSYELDKNGSWKEFINFLKVLNTEPDKLDQVLNIDQTLWMMALDNIMVNLDSYLGKFSHNYYMYRGEDGRFIPVIWDLNLSFGGFNLDGASETGLTTEQMQRLSPMLHSENVKRPLLSQLLKTPIYQKLYLAHYRTIFNDWFSNGQYLKKAKDITQTIDFYVKNDEQKLYSYESFVQNMNQTVLAGKTNIVGISELMTKRIEYLGNHPLIKKQAPLLSDKSTGLVETDKMSFKVKAENAQKVWLVWRADKKSPFKYLAMTDDGKHEDGEANDKVFGVVVNKKEQVEYYFLAENQDAAITLPEKAAHEFFSLR
jgi:hypothetical protein